MKRFLLLPAIFILLLTPSLAQEKNIDAIDLNYLECEGDLAVFVLENKSKQPIYIRVQSVSYWEEWKKAKAYYGTFTAKYKAADSSSFIDVSDRFDAPINFKTISPQTIIRYGIPLRKGAGVYKVSVPYIDNLRMKKTIDNFGNLSSEEIEQISWKEVSSKEVFIPCK